MVAAALQCSCEHNGHKFGLFNATPWQRQKKPLDNDNYILKMSSNYHMEQKTLIEASYTNNIHTLKNVSIQIK